MNASPKSGLFLGITYSYGTVAAINVSTVTVSSGATLNIGAYNSIIVNSKMVVEKQGLLELSQIVASVAGPGDVTVAGTVVWSAGCFQGSGKLIVQDGGLVYANEGPAELYLLRNLHVLQGGNFTAIGHLHISFWWQLGNIMIEVDGFLQFGTTWNSWIKWQNGTLLVQKGGTAVLDTLFYGYPYIINIGNLTLGQGYVDDGSYQIQNYGTVTVAEYSYIQSVSTAFQQYGGTVALNGGTVLFRQTTQSVNSKFTVSNQGYLEFMVNTYGSFPVFFQYYGFTYGGFYSPGPVTALVFDGSEIYTSGGCNTAFVSPFYLDGGGLTLAGPGQVSFEQENSAIEGPGSLVIQAGTDVNFLLQSQFNGTGSVQIYGNVTVTANASVVSQSVFQIFPGGLLSVNSEGVLDFVQGGYLENCGGQLVVDGSLQGNPVRPCSTPPAPPAVGSIGIARN